MNQIFHPLALVVALAAAFPAASAFAAAEASASASASDVIVTASRQPQAAQDVLADNVVISAEQIALSGAASVTDLLRMQRGIEIASNGGSGANASVFMRGGSNPQNLVLVDGVRIGSTTAGGATWATLALSEIDHIEIIYGPLSSLYGADAMSGVIQIFTKKGRGAASTSVAVGAGSYGLRKFQAGISGAADNHFSYALSAVHENNTGFSATKPSAGKYSYNADKDGYKLESATGNVNWELSRGYELGMNFMQSRLNTQFDSGPSYDDRNIEKLQTVAVYGKAKFSDDWSSMLQFAQSGDYGYTDASYGKSQIDSHQNLLSFQNTLRFGKNSLQVIAETREEKVNGSEDALNRQRRTNSLAASYLMKQDAHLLSASLRRDQNSDYGSNTTGSLAYGYRLNDAWRINASYGSSFRAPTFNDLFYPGYGIATLKPEQAKNAEVGAYYELGDTQLSVVYFQNKAKDLLVFTNNCPVQQHPYGCSYNVGSATMSGLSLGGSTRYADWRLRGSLDVQNPRDDVSGLQLARRSKQHASVALDYALPKAKIGMETVFASKRFDDTANTKVLGGYSLLNLYVSYDLAKNLALLGRWNNVLNKEYELAKNYGTAGSNVYVGLNYGFK